MSELPTAAPQRGALYRTIWRWHFYAGLFVIPFILMLSVTGAVYLFKPQIDRWEEGRYASISAGVAVSPNVQLAAALSAFPGAAFQSYRLPEKPGEPAMVHLALADGRSMRDVFVSADGKMLGSRDPDMTISETVSRVHGSLLIGRLGDWLVELAACWAIVMILTGLFLWWPKGGGLAGVLWPRLAKGKRLFWRDLHAVTGFWMSGLVLVLLVSGLPWADVWGDAFKYARAELGWVQGVQDWKTSAEHVEHDHDAMLRQQKAGVPMTALADIVAKAKGERLAFPVIVSAPAADTEMAWTVKSQAQNRPLRREIRYDVATGAELSRTGFADRHVIDRVVGYGIAWHEGQLFGWINQLVGLVTAIGLMTLTVSGFVMWRRRKPDGVLGAPRNPAVPVRIKGVVAITVLLAALLPLLALSLLVLWLFDRLILPRLPGIAGWLGVAKRQAA